MNYLILITQPYQSMEFTIQSLTLASLTITWFLSICFIKQQLQTGTLFTTLDLKKLLVRPFQLKWNVNNWIFQSAISTIIKKTLFIAFTDMASRSLFQLMTLNKFKNRKLLNKVLVKCTSFTTKFWLWMLLTKSCSLKELMFMKMMATQDHKNGNNIQVSKMEVLFTLSKETLKFKSQLRGSSTSIELIKRLLCLF